MRHPAFAGSLLAAAAFAWLPASSEAQSSTDKVKQTTEETKSAVKEMTKEAQADLSDTWITSKTKIALFADDRVKGRQVSVETDKGVVSLRGKVDSADAKAAAASVAQGIEGVTSVRNDLQVVAPADQKAVAADDKEIKRSIEARFAGDLQLKKIDVRSDAGLVTLTGEAPSIMAAARASEIARSMPAVRAVRNDVTYKERSASTGRSDMRATSRDMRHSAGAMGSDHVRAMQEALKGKGFDPGPIDGVYGPQTANALKEYQRSENLSATGRADAQTLDKLGVEGRPQS